MRKFDSAIIAFLIPLTGCSSSGGLSGVTDFVQQLNNEKSNEIKLITAFRAEDAALKRLSGNRYSCGNPKDRRLQDILGPKSADAVAATDYNFDSARWSTSIQIITTYSAAMKAIDTDQQNRADTIKALMTASQNLASVFNPPPLSAAIAVFKGSQALLTDINAIAALEQKKEIARKMKDQLAVAVKYLSNQEVLKQLSEPEQQVFKLWDSCAVETISYFIDLGDPVFYSKYGPPLSKAYPAARLAPATGYEVYTTQAKYDSDRASLNVKTDLSKPLKQILTQNDALIQGYDVDWKTLDTYAQDACAAFTAFESSQGNKNSCSVPTINLDPGNAVGAPAQTPNGPAATPKS